MRTGTMAMIAACVGLAAAGCAHPVESGLRDARRAGGVPAGFAVVYDDHHGLWGGERIAVGADGRIEVRRWRPGQTDEPEGWSGRVPRKELRRLVDLLVRIEAWEQRVDARSPRIDEGRARLVVTVGGERASTWEWSNDLEANGRLLLVKERLETLARTARTDSGASQ